MFPRPLRVARRSVPRLPLPKRLVRPSKSRLPTKNLRRHRLRMISGMRWAAGTCRNRRRRKAPRRQQTEVVDEVAVGRTIEAAVIAVVGIGAVATVAVETAAAATVDLGVMRRVRRLLGPKHRGLKRHVQKHRGAKRLPVIATNRWFVRIAKPMRREKVVVQRVVIEAVVRDHRKQRAKWPVPLRLMMIPGVVICWTKWPRRLPRLPRRVIQPKVGRNRAIRVDDVVVAGVGVVVAVGTMSVMMRRPSMAISMTPWPMFLRRSLRKITKRKRLNRHAVDVIGVAVEAGDVRLFAVSLRTMKNRWNPTTSKRCPRVKRMTRTTKTTIRLNPVRGGLCRRGKRRSNSCCAPTWSKLILPVLAGSRLVVRQVMGRGARHVTTGLASSRSGLAISRGPV